MCPNYDFECSECGTVFERFKGMFDETPVYCRCGGRADQLLSTGYHTSKDKLWEFTDVHITGKPIEIRSKGQWKSTLKQHNKHDDMNMKSMEIINKSYQENKKETARRNINEGVVSAMKDLKARGLWKK